MNSFKWLMLSLCYSVVISGATYGSDNKIFAEHVCDMYYYNGHLEDKSDESKFIGTKRKGSVELNNSTSTSSENEEKHNYVSDQFARDGWEAVKKSIQSNNCDELTKEQIIGCFCYIPELLANNDFGAYGIQKVLEIYTKLQIPQKLNEDTLLNKQYQILAASLVWFWSNIKMSLGNNNNELLNKVIQKINSALNTITIAGLNKFLVGDHIDENMSHEFSDKIVDIINK